MLGKLLYEYMKPYWASLLAVLALQMTSVIMNLYLPTLNASIIDQGVAKGDTAFIWARGGLMLALSFVQILSSIGAVFFAAKVSMSVGRDIRDAVYSKVSSFSEREVKEFGPGSLITRNTNDVQQVQMLAMMGSTMLVMAPLMAIGGVVMALRQDLGMAWLIAVSVPLLLALAGAVITRLIPLFRSYQEKLDQVNLVMREQLTGVRVIRAFVREAVEEARFKVANYDIMIVGRKVGSLFVLLFPMVSLVLNFTVAGVIWFGAGRIDSGQIEVGTVMAFMQYITQILFGVLMATFMAVMIPRAAVSAERIRAVLDTEDHLRQPNNPVFTMPTPGEVRFDKVFFQYPDAEDAVLHDISFTAKPGKTLAIVGSTAAGKSTLISLIPRLLDATGGEVYVGGTQVRDLDLETLWESIGLVPQKAFLFSGTIASNLRFGNPNATDDELWEALTIAQASDFVKEMNGGLDARIAQGGTNVSGGQRQRLAIARALVKNPDIFIFDDSFSALDLTTDANLRTALWQAFPHATKIVVAQRISTIIDAEQIMVLDRGRIVGLGSHNDLVESCPTYQEIVESQLAAEAL